MNKITKKILGYCAVDSGQILLVDPCYLSEWKDGESEDLNSHYGQACKLTMNKNQGGELLVSSIAGTGVVATSGDGDGWYPVEATYQEDKYGKRIKKLTITFR